MKVLRILFTFILCFGSHFLLAQAKKDSTSSAPKVADMHYHLSMRAYNEHGIQITDDLKKKKLPPNDLINYARTKKLKIKYGRLSSKKPNNMLYQYTQATIPHMKEGNVFLAFNAISPFEYGVNNKGSKRLISSLGKSGGKIKWLKRLGDLNEMTHWENFNYEYKFITSQDTMMDNLHWRFLYHGKQLEEYPDIPFVVNVVEGSHILQDLYFPHAHDTKLKNNVKFYTESNKKINPLEQENERRQELINNIDSLKRLPIPIFMLTISHLTYNDITGHALALDTEGFPAKDFLRRYYRAKVSNNDNIVSSWKELFYSELGLNARYGKLVIDSLLSETNGHRIFIDMKHSDFFTRQYILDSVTIQPNGDTIPPICSHCAVTGLPEEYYSPYVDEYALAASNVSQTHYPFSINLYDEEITKICQNKGIIGITLEERGLGGYIKKKQRLKEIETYFENEARGNGKMKYQYIGNEKIREAFEYTKTKFNTIPNDKIAYRITTEDYWRLEPFMQNLFHVLDKSGKSYGEAWKHVCIGSDLDGIIDPLEICPTASQYPYMYDRLMHFIPLFLELDKKNEQPHYGDYSDYFNETFKLKEALDALFYNSLKRFVIENFKK